RSKADTGKGLVRVGRPPSPAAWKSLDRDIAVAFAPGRRPARGRSARHPPGAGPGASAAKVAGMRSHSLFPSIGLVLASGLVVAGCAGGARSGSADRGATT